MKATRKKTGQKIRSDIHKNSHKLSIQEIIELQEKLTECLGFKLRLRQPVRECDVELVEKYANPTTFQIWSKSAINTPS